jgi:hypothetical protein
LGSRSSFSLTHTRPTAGRRRRCTHGLGVETVVPPWYPCPPPWARPKREVGISPAHPLLVPGSPSASGTPTGTNATARRSSRNTFARKIYKRVVRSPRRTPPCLVDFRVMLTAGCANMVVLLLHTWSFGSACNSLRGVRSGREVGPFVAHGTVPSADRGTVVIPQ